MRNRKCKYKRAEEKKAEVMVMTQHRAGPCTQVRGKWLAESCTLYEHVHGISLRVAVCPAC